jgi:hypothetical protein
LSDSTDDEEVAAVVEFFTGIDDLDSVDIDDDFKVVESNIPSSESSMTSSVEGLIDCFERFSSS